MALGTSLQSHAQRAASVHQTRGARARILLLTGAGISTESGIPDFRGPAGYWTEGSVHHVPTDMATQRMFRQRPGLVWAWYLHRLRAGSTAQPNAAHIATANFLLQIPESLLITQNVDGLHHRAGAPEARTFAVHGSIQNTRCADACTPALRPLTQVQLNLAPPAERPSELSSDALAQLRCPNCRGLLRPHVLWFDECYDEALFRWNSTLEAAQSASILITVGSTGATNLPWTTAQVAARAGAYPIDINLEDNPFAQLARSTGGASLIGKAGELLPPLLEALTAHIVSPPREIPH